MLGKIMDIDQSGLVYLMTLEAWLQSQVVKK